MTKSKSNFRSHERGLKGTGIDRLKGQTGRRGGVLTYDRESSPCGIVGVNDGSGYTIVQYQKESAKREDYP